MRQMEIIECDRFYHIYNRGINGENLFYSKKTKILRNQVLKWFDGSLNFVETHQQKIDIISIEKWLKI